MPRNKNIHLIAKNDLPGLRHAGSGLPHHQDIVPLVEGHLKRRLLVALNQLGGLGRSLDAGDHDTLDPRPGRVRRVLVNEAENFIP